VVAGCQSGGSESGTVPSETRALHVSHSRSMSVGEIESRTCLSVATSVPSMAIHSCFALNPMRLCTHSMVESGALKCQDTDSPAPATEKALLLTMRVDPLAPSAHLRAGSRFSKTAVLNRIGSASSLSQMGRFRLFRRSSKRDDDAKRHKCDSGSDYKTHEVRSRPT
jgi:hypothetical protein